MYKRQPKASGISDGDIPVKLWLLSRKERICSLVRDKSAVPEPDDLLRLACISNPHSQTAVNRACLSVRVPLPDVYKRQRLSCGMAGPFLSGIGKKTWLPSSVKPMKSVVIWKKKWYNIKDMYFRTWFRGIVIRRFSGDVWPAGKVWAGSDYG